MEITNILFSGVGGQGILTSSRVLALAAVDAGLDVKMSEVHGMAQRGGSVDTHVRIGPEVPSSLIPMGGADFVVAFEKLEALRYMPYLKPDGVVFACPVEIPPLTQNLRKNAGYVEEIDKKLKQYAPELVMIDSPAIAKEIGDVRMVNIIMLGALSTRMKIEKGNWENGIKKRFSPKIQEACIAAFNRGREACQKQ